MAYLQLDMEGLFPKPEGVAIASSCTQPTRAEWDLFRPVIKRLYVDEGKTLKEVMAIMERDYGHCATAKMYKDRIKKWNLDKKTKETEARAMLRMKTQRTTIGKESVFRVRGKTVTIDDVLRYFKRKGILNPEVEAQTAEASMSTAIECWTPPPTPKLGSATTLGPGESGVDLYDPLGTEMGGVPYMALDATQSSVVNAYLDMDQTRQILFSNPEIQSFEVPDSPLPPQSLLVFEKLFASITTYLSGAFDSGLFTDDETGRLSSAIAPRGNENLNSFRDLCYAGLELMKSKSFAEGRRYLSKASGLVSHLLREQHPRALEFFFNVLMRMSSYGYNEIARIFQALACEMAIEILAKEHPFRHILCHINNLEDSHYDPGLAQAFKCILDKFASCLGQFHPTVLQCYASCIIDANVSNGPQLLRCLLIRGEQELGKSDDCLLDIKCSIGYALYNQQQYTEATEVLEDVLVHLRPFGRKGGLVVNVLELLSFCQYHLDHKADAESKLREGIEMAVKVYGENDSMVLNFKTYLSSWLQEWGREIESDVLKTEIDEILGPDDIEIDDM